MIQSKPLPKDILISHMMQSVPERKEEISSLWEHYNPDVIFLEDRPHITLHANKDCIAFDAKTMEVFWLIGFAGWRAIECYTPHVVSSALIKKPIEDIIKDDDGLYRVEQSYKEKLSAIQRTISSTDPTLEPWPNDLPRPNVNRDAINDTQYKAAFDLTCTAVAFALFHEFRHVMLDRDNKRPKDRREEELACDVWAREYMTSKLAMYAKKNKCNYFDLLSRRSMGLALNVLILHEITPIWDHGGNKEYFSVVTRLNALLENTPLPETDNFWIFSASLLIGVFRQKNLCIDTRPLSPKDLTHYLLSKL